MARAKDPPARDDLVQGDDSVGAEIGGYHVKTSSGTSAPLSLRQFNSKFLHL
jgi:hypothetical protein